MTGVADQTTPTSMTPPARREGALNGFRDTVASSLPRSPTKTNPLSTATPATMPGAPAPTAPGGYDPISYYNTGGYRPLPTPAPAAPSATRPLTSLPSYQSVYAQVQSQYAPNVIDLQRQMAQGQLGNLVDNSRMQLKENLVRANYGYEMQGLGVREQGMGIDRSNLNLQRADLNTDAGYLTRQRGFADTDHTLTAGNINRDSDANRVATKSEYIGRGAQFTPMLAYKDRVRGEQLQSDLAGNNLSRDRTMAGLDRDQAKLGNDLARNTNSMTALDLTAQTIGIDRNKLLTSLNDTIANLGLDRYVSAESLAQMLTSGDEQQQAIAQQIIMEATGMHYDMMQDPATAAQMNALDAPPSVPAGWNFRPKS